MKMMFLLSWTLIFSTASGFYVQHLKAEENNQKEDKVNEVSCPKVVQAIEKIAPLMDAHPLPRSFNKEAKQFYEIFKSAMMNSSAGASVFNEHGEFDKEFFDNLSTKEQTELRGIYCESATKLLNQLHELHIDYGVYAQGLLARRQTFFSAAYQRRYYRIMGEYNGNKGNNADSFYDPLKEFDKRTQKYMDEI